MGVVTGFIVYLLVYWVTLFCVLPWGNKPTGTTDNGKIVASAPINPRLKKKFIITGLISIVLWLIIYILIDMKIIDFHGIARSLHEEDLK